ncbi:uncharacterized protein BX663DRAFT_517185 [Cokeromyces recurvatus]|uniref:uncharacterized protein n=1 Tax=Cokeromyces recurvatus TaxID=90255 RepID=UPI00221F415C|nr:uncharacterized protein BX663DRAFT_517185 [Cokeromyces recurvatus]KAI7900667.1 hypothetical protein BX663DRAFT_517185 [Cokeromyces recurvatus]
MRPVYLVTQFRLLCLLFFPSLSFYIYILTKMKKKTIYYTIYFFGNVYFYVLF